MSRPELILPQADASCGKVFFPDRRTADDHRVGLEVWNRATGRTREGYRLAVFRCKRCGGYHLSYKRVDPGANPPRLLSDLRNDAGHDDGDQPFGRGPLAPTIRRSAQHDPAWA